MIPGEWKEELEFREIKNVSTTIPRSAHLFNSSLNSIIMLGYFDWSNSILVKCPKQGKRNNLCGYYVCEFIRHMTCDNTSPDGELYQFRVRKPYSQFKFITINCVEFHSYMLTPFFKLDRTVAGRSSTAETRTGNSRGNCRILRCRGPKCEWRVLLPAADSIVKE